MGEIMTIVNQKGGVGKTMTAVSLSACLRKYESKVLLVDLDPQGHSTKAFGYRNRNEYSLSMKEVMICVIKNRDVDKEKLILHSHEGVDIIPANISLAGISSILEGTQCRETTLKRFLDTVKNDYDYIIIDTNPSLDNLTINALTAADKAIIPVQAEPYAIEGMADLLKTITNVQCYLNPDLTIEGILITMFDKRTNLAKKVIMDIHHSFGNYIRIFNTQIPRCIKAAESTGNGESIIKYDRKCAATKAYELLTQEVFYHGEKDSE